MNDIPDQMSAAEYVSKIETKEIEDKTRSLSKEIDDYLKSEESMMLLLGDPGVGKSLFAWHSTQSLLEGAKTSDTQWLPIVIELKDYRMSEIKDLLPRYLSEHCKLSSKEPVVIQQDKNLKHRILLVLDGFDELKQEENGQAAKIKKTFEDCFKTSGAQAWHAGQIKMVVTCRLRHILDRGVEKQYFGYGSKQVFRRRVFLPFSSQQIKTYLDERTEIETKSGSLLSAETYLSVINAAESVKAMVRNPFILRLFVDALPELQNQGHELTTIKRYDIYQAFVKQWFRRETERLDGAIRAQLPTENRGS